MARRIGDPGTLAYALAGYVTANHSPEFTHTQVTLATELAEVALTAGDLERAAEGYEQRAGALFELGDLPGAKADLATLSRLAAELRQPSHDWLVAIHSAVVALLEGELADAENLVAGARSLAEHVLSWNTAVSYGIQLFMLRREQGRLGEVEDTVRRSVEEYPTYTMWRCVLIDMTAELGYMAEARATLEALAADRFAAVPFDEDWLVSMSLLAQTARALGDAEHASVLYELLLPYSERVAVAYAEISVGSVSHYLALLAATMQRWDDAARHFEAALAMNARIGARPWLAHTQEDYAQMLLAQRTDRDKALGLLDDALATYHDLGMQACAQTLASKETPAAGRPATRSHN